MGIDDSSDIPHISDMACYLLLSIRPVYVKEIISGKKIYEYRMTIPRRKVDGVFIYETSPTMKVVAEASLDTIVQDVPEKVYETTHLHGGISHKDFVSYFEGLNMAYALKLSNVRVLDEPLTLDKLGVKHAPQSWMYVDF